eukprot:2119673-Rhodomonas_salina.2
MLACRSESGLSWNRRGQKRRCRRPACSNQNTQQRKPKLTRCVIAALLRWHLQDSKKHRFALLRNSSHNFLGQSSQLWVQGQASNAGSAQGQQGAASALCETAQCTG